jgi:hypothetical protein
MKGDGSFRTDCIIGMTRRLAYLHNQGAANGMQFSSHTHVGRYFLRTHAIGCWRIAAKETRKLSVESSHDVTDAVVCCDSDPIASRHFGKHTVAWAI